MANVLLVYYLFAAYLFDDQMNGIIQDRREDVSALEEQTAIMRFVYG
jgi:hypothetical protein